MSMYKKLPFADEAIKRYLKFEPHSFERETIKEGTMAFLKDLKGIHMPDDEDEQVYNTLHEWGFMKGWFSYLKSHHKKKDPDVSIKELEHFLKKIVEVEE